VSAELKKDPKKDAEIKDLQIQFQKEPPLINIEPENDQNCNNKKESNQIYLNESIFEENSMEVSKINNFMYESFNTQNFEHNFFELMNVPIENKNNKNQMWILHKHVN